MFAPLVSRLAFCAIGFVILGVILFGLLQVEIIEENKQVGLSGNPRGLLSRRNRFRGVVYQKLLQFSFLAAAGCFAGAVILRVLGKR
jgi:hypothetical protein